MKGPFNKFSDDLKNIFGCRVQRISVDAGFTCPNRDGTIGKDGCIFCGEDGSGAAGIRRELSLSEQIEHGRQVMISKYKAEKFIAYFQAYSNTYGHVELLRARYDEALSLKDMVGLIVATRPDCINSEVLSLLKSYSDSTYFWLELGMQSSSDRTLKTIRRGHDFGTLKRVVGECRALGIRICVHLIFGLPGEDRDEMLANAEILNAMGVNGVKIHMLNVVKGTPLAEMYYRGELSIAGRDEYVGLVCDFLERLKSDILVHRVSGEASRDRHIAPDWSLKKYEVLNAIDAEFRRRISFQGCLLG